jgi:hypothetical protein
MDVVHPVKAIVDEKIGLYSVKEPGSRPGWLRLGGSGQQSEDELTNHVTCHEFFEQIMVDLSCMGPKLTSNPLASELGFAFIDP